MEREHGDAHPRRPGVPDPIDIVDPSHANAQISAACTELLRMTELVV